MSLFDEMVLDRDAVILDDIAVTVINLTTRKTCQGFFQGDDVSADGKSGLANLVKSTLWIPIEVSGFAQEHKLLIVQLDGTREEFTITAGGARQGTLKKYELAQVKQTRTRQGITL